ncbi:hypothetical protein GCM10009087_19010 [Sphingomonas oligophenolica]|uniref:Uncharacterized protein n=2 Tax=Sphingomonas oligophenolica TaxID=301154 RepID=A0ABU9Y351_9SPHN
MPERSTDRHASHDDDAVLRLLATLEIALSDEELSMATILQFDPDADPSPASQNLQTDRPPMRAISGAAFSQGTWEKLARRYFTPSASLDASQALQRFLTWRARYPDA